jgi:multidrug efflux system membrane fusion protein
MNQPLKPLKEAPAVEKKAQPKRGWGKRLAWFSVALLIVAGIVWWNRQEPARQSPGGGRNAGAISIVPEPIGKGDIGINLNALGTVTSLATVTIRTQISGYLMKVDFTEGQEVKKGDLLAQIDPRPYEAVLAQAKGNLARDEALLKGAQVDLARYQGLAAQNAIPHQTLDTQIALVSQDTGSVEADRATVKAAEVNLQYCRIVSPLDGRVGLRQVDQGNYVTPGDTNGLVVITQLQPISVLFTLPEDNLQAISKRINDGATLPAAAYDRGGANKLADGVLYPNQFVNIRLLVDTHNDVVVMPTAGIQRGVPGTFVYLVNDDSTVSVRKVVLGITDGNRVEVSSGLAPGDRIVVDGADKLRDGAKINIRTEADANAPPKANPGSKAGPDPSGGKKRRSDDGQKQ